MLVGSLQCTYDYMIMENMLMLIEKKYFDPCWMHLDTFSNDCDTLDIIGYHRDAKNDTKNNINAEIIPITLYPVANWKTPDACLKYSKVY